MWELLLVANIIIGTVLFVKTVREEVRLREAYLSGEYSPGWNMRNEKQRFLIALGFAAAWIVFCITILPTLWVLKCLRTDA